MRRATILLFLALLAAATAQAVMLEVPLETTTSKAVEIVRGEVISQKSAWTYDNRMIWTDVVVRVDETLKGNLKAGQTVTVRVEGGVAEGIRVRVEHEPRFHDAEKVVLFLRESSEGGYAVQSVEQGKFTVFDDVVYDCRGHSQSLSRFKNSIAAMVGQDQR